MPRLVLKLTTSHEHGSRQGEGPTQASIGRYHIGLGHVGRDKPLNSQPDQQGIHRVLLSYCVSQDTPLRGQKALVTEAMLKSSGARLGHNWFSEAKSPP